MANEADSRHTTPFPRWGETAAEVPSVNVVEPSGGKKNTGWLPGSDGIVGEWWNWLHWAAGVFFRYLENTFELGLTRNHVMAGAAAGEGAVTVGAGLSVNVASARCWIEGQMHTVPAATNLALATADATLNRRDLVIARVTSLVPEYAVVTGTPSASPFPALPALPAGACPIGAAVVAAAAVVPNNLTDEREFGALSVDRLIAGKRLDAGAHDTGLSMLVVTGTTAAGGSGILQIGEQADLLLEANYNSAGGDYLAVRKDTFKTITAVTRKYDLSWLHFVTNDAVPVRGSSGWSAISSTGNIEAPIRVPDGATITDVRVYGNKTATGDNLIINFVRRERATGTRTVIAGPADNDGTAIGNFVLAFPAFTHVVDQEYVYVLEVFFAPDTGTITMYNAEVTYTEQFPLAGI